MASEDDSVSLEDLPDHLLDSILRACDSSDYKRLRLLSRRMHGLIAILIKHVSCQCPGFPLMSIHELFPLITHLTISTPTRHHADNEGLMQIQEAFASFWMDELPSNGPSCSDTDSSDDQIPSQLEMFCQRSLPHLQHLTSLKISGEMSYDELRDLTENLPTSCTRLSLPHTKHLGYEKINRLVRSDLQLFLSGQKTIADPNDRFLAQLPALSSAIASLEVTLLDESDVGLLLIGLVNIKSISLSWPCSGSVFTVADSCRSLLTCLKPPSPLGMSCLTSLSLYSFLGSVPSLIEALATLPSLRRLNIFNFNVNHYLTMNTLSIIFQHLPLLEHLGSNGIDLTIDPDVHLVGEEWVMVQDHSQLSLPTIISLEVGISVAGPGRIRDVFPNLESIQLRWSWSALTRKIAGLLHLTKLSIACPEYLEDFRLLRTLPILKYLKLSKGCGTDIISSALEVFVDSKLEEFELHEWIDGKAQDQERLHQAIFCLNQLQTIGLVYITHVTAKVILRAAYESSSILKIRIGCDLRGLATIASIEASQLVEIEIYIDE